MVAGTPVSGGRGGLLAFSTLSDLKQLRRQIWRRLNRVVDGENVTFETFCVVTLLLSVTLQPAFYLGCDGVTVEIGGIGKIFFDN